MSILRNHSTAWSAGPLVAPGKRQAPGTRQGFWPPRPKHSVWDSKPRTPAGGTKPVTAASWSSSYARNIRLTDLFVTCFVITVAFMGRFFLDLPGDPAASLNGYIPLSLLLLVVWNATLEIFSSRERRIFGLGATEYKRIIHSTLSAFGLLAIFMVVFKLDVVRGFFAIALPLGIFLLMLSRWLWRRWLARRRTAGGCFSNAVVMGTTEDAQYVISQLRSNPATGYRVAGVALTSLAAGTELNPPWYRLPVFSSSARIENVLAATGADTVIVAGNLPGGPATIQQLGWDLGELHTELVLASSLTNVAGPRVHFRPVEGLPLMHVELPQYSGGKHLYKRAMDVVLSATGLLFLSPVLLLLALIVRMDSAGPALFHQERVGRNGETFKMLKFRSMVVDAEKLLDGLAGKNEGAGPLFKMARDPRITGCGRWMRKYSLDELPQLWNVLIGDMSLVGPRPPLAKEVAEYQAPAGRRLLIKPGITGLWQVSGRSILPWEESVRLDLYYVENWSLTGDFIILWRTAKAVYSPEGAS
ncbi:sugar transferase [Arthrobacter sp. LAPM80]|uniref:sugar transferase n=1 Tax=Arthrobacter sp. LAPM80 TaxID=3141788 RepID=UPI00398A6FBC